MTRLGKLGTCCFCFNVKRDFNGVVVDLKEGVHHPLNSYHEEKLRHGNLIVLNDKIVIHNAAKYEKVSAFDIEGTHNGEPVYVRLNEIL